MRGAAARGYVGASSGEERSPPDLVDRPRAMRSSSPIPLELTTLRGQRDCILGSSGSFLPVILRDRCWLRHCGTGPHGSHNPSDNPAHGPGAGSEPDDIAAGRRADADRAGPQSILSRPGRRTGTARGRASAPGTADRERSPDAELGRAHRDAAGCRDSAKTAPTAVSIHVPGRRSPGHQRVRAPWRTDLREPRHARGSEKRGRGRRRDRARDQPHRAAARYRAGDQGPEVSVRRARGTDLSDR